ncbi:MAG: D-tyrosyl-tRNA(Tyr) deacylase [Clostridia bacterium]|jgi:D-tyrosyl-tRNA(Tyr) deacylase|nr:D-tyrosyl-tRNA(Tyr) deacylase [Clostridia bacterium]
MRCVVQRVTEAKVTVVQEDGSEQLAGQIGPGIMALIGVSTEDTEKDLKYLADKVPNLRIFDDENGVMNRSILDAGGAILAVSQFTLYGDARGGRRPSYIRAAKPEEANALYEKLVAAWREKGIPVETGRFRTEMRVSLTNDGPVTILLDSEKQF